MSLPGIGSKGAQRIVLELRERIAKQFKTRGRSPAGTWPKTPLPR